ncbi:MAG: hypothetical protein WCB12_06765 [Bryobacteraceae bacterium]
MARDGTAARITPPKAMPSGTLCKAIAIGTATRRPSGAACCTTATLQPSKKLCSAAAAISGAAKPCNSVPQAS